MPQIVNLSADDGTMRRNHHFRSDLRDRILSGDKFTRLITILLLSLAEVGDMRMRNLISAFGAKIQASCAAGIGRVKAISFPRDTVNGPAFAATLRAGPPSAGISSISWFPVR